MMKTVTLISGIVFLFSSFSSLAANVDKAMVNSVQEQLAQMQKMWTEVPQNIELIAGGIQSQLKDCTQYDSDKASSLCLNANSYYSEYVKAISQNVSQDVIEQAYSNYMEATQEAISVINNLNTLNYK